MAVHIEGCPFKILTSSQTVKNSFVGTFFFISLIASVTLLLPSADNFAEFVLNKALAFKVILFLTIFFCFFLSNKENVYAAGNEFEDPYEYYCAYGTQVIYNQGYL